MRPGRIPGDFDHRVGCNPVATAPGTDLIIRPRPRFWLERELYRQLHLPGIAHALPQETVEVKETRRGERTLISSAAERVDEIFIVEGIEHFHGGDQLVPLAKFKWPR